MEEFILLSALNQYEYCPRRCHYIFVENVFIDNEHTVEGSLLHGRADSGETSTRAGTPQWRSVYLYARQLGISGKADVIEERAGELIPIEYKKGKRGQWTNDALQLCAQALCLEEMTGKPVERGYLYYATTGRRQEVVFTAELRQQTLATIAAVRRLIASGDRPPNPYTPRCKGCSLSDICLPKETARLQQPSGG
ncbi:MAG: CRISPR-associated protein Cas4 [Deltaproteobacteria bacterium]|nr:CRISPR-associated protein Cas4 [Deltaproteobacteria bacterium]